MHGNLYGSVDGILMILSMGSLEDITAHERLDDFLL